MNPSWFPGLHRTALQWRHNGNDGVSNDQPHDCLLGRLFRRTSKKTAKLRVTGLWAGNSPVTGEFPTQRASNAENVSIWWRHHGMMVADCNVACNATSSVIIMTSSNRNFFGVTDPLWGESTGHRWIPLTKASDAELWCFLGSTPEQTIEQTIEASVIWVTIVLIMASL